MDTKPQGLDGEFARRVIKLMAAVNVRVYKLTRGRIGGTWRVGAGWRNPVPICLLEHRGRRTGKLRTTPLGLPARTRTVSSWWPRRPAGRHHPLWFRNIEADPEVTVQIRGERRPMRARTADAEERCRAVAPPGRPLQRLRLLPVLDRPGDPGRPPRTAVRSGRRPMPAGAVTIRQRGARPLDPPWRQDEVGPGNHTGGHDLNTRDPWGGRPEHVGGPSSVHTADPAACSPVRSRSKGARSARSPGAGCAATRSPSPAGRSSSS